MQSNYYKKKSKSKKISITKSYRFLTKGNDTYFYYGQDPVAKTDGRLKILILKKHEQKIKFITKQFQGELLSYGHFDVSIIKSFKDPTHLEITHKKKYTIYIKSHE